MDRFRTTRLTGERLHQRHLDDLVAFHLDEEVSRYLGGVRTPKATEAYLAANIAHWDEHGFGLWVLRTPDGRFVGRAGLRHVEVDGAEEVEIAYALHQTFWGQGLASEIATALIRIAFDDLKLQSLVGVVFIGNTPSCRVLEKAGFLYEKTAEFHGAPCVVYRLHRP